MALKLSNINQPTSAKWVKLGSTCLAVSTAIQGYSLTQTNVIVGYIGLGFLVIGTLLVTFKD